jgi:uncharacterized protein YerC
MNKFDFDKKRIKKLPKKDQEQLVYDLVNAVVQSGSVSEAALFLQDLLTKKEMEILSKRLKIAKLLLIGRTYEEIEKEIYTSHSTIAKIAAWLSERGEGFRKIIAKLPKQSETKILKDKSELDLIKRRNSMYFWPELLLEEIIKNSSRRQKKKIESVLVRLEEKSEIHKNIEKILHKV